MARGKKQEDKKKAIKKEVIPEKVAAKAGPPKGSRKKRIFKPRFLKPVRRLCKDLDIIIPSRDGQEVVEGVYERFAGDFMNHLNKFAGVKKTITHDTIKLAFIGYMDALGVSDEISRAALERSDTAVGNLALVNGSQ